MCSRILKTVLLLFALAVSAAEVAGAGPAAKPRFLVSDMVVKDAVSGLVWTRNGNPAGHTLSWHDAIRFVSMLNKQNYGGHSDWRLPAINELKKLSSALREKGDAESGLAQAGFYGVQAGDYWSSSSSIFNNREAFSINMLSGGELVSSKSLYMFVWPVRWEGTKRRGAGAAQGNASSRPTGRPSEPDRM